MNSGLYMTRERVDKILWWIPFKWLRYLLRSYLYKIIQIDEKLDTLIHNDSLLLEQNIEICKKMDFFLRKENLKSKVDEETVIMWMGGGLADQIRHYCAGFIAETLYNKKVDYELVEGNDGNKAILIFI